MPHVFLSYSHKDTAYARRLANELKQNSIDVWMDDRIDYGTQWPRVIQENLEASAAVLVIMSTNAYKSNWVQNEVAHAKGKGKDFFPVLLEGDSWLSLAATQYTDVRGGVLPPQSYFQAIANHVSSTAFRTSPRILTVIELLEQIRNAGETVVSVEAAREIHQIGFPDTDVGGFLILTDMRLLFKPHESNISFDVSLFNLHYDGQRLRDMWDDDYELCLIDPSSSKIRSFSIRNSEMVQTLQSQFPHLSEGNGAT